MNYNRRSTRPDSLFYREQRKLRRSRGIRSIGPVALLIAAAAVAAILWYIFKKP